MHQPHPPKAGEPAAFRSISLASAARGSRLREHVRPKAGQLGAVEHRARPLADRAHERLRDRCPRRAPEAPAPLPGAKRRAHFS